VNGLEFFMGDVSIFLCLFIQLFISAWLLEIWILIRILMPYPVGMNSISCLPTVCMNVSFVFDLTDSTIYHVGQSNFFPLPSSMKLFHMFVIQ
jgi:hypothetical protein